MWPAGSASSPSRRSGGYSRLRAALSVGAARAVTAAQVAAFATRCSVTGAFLFNCGASLAAAHGDAQAAALTVEWARE